MAEHVEGFEGGGFGFPVASRGPLKHLCVLLDYFGRREDEAGGQFGSRRGEGVGEGCRDGCWEGLGEKGFGGFVGIEEDAGCVVEREEDEEVSK